MKIARLARNVIFVGLVWRLIARRRAALARERRSRRIAPLLITAGGTGVFLVARPRILEGARRLWDVARRQSGGKTSNVASGPQRDVGAPADRAQVIAPSAKPRPGRFQEDEQKPRGLAETEPKPRVKKSRKRVARAEQSEKSTRKTSYSVKGESEKRSEPGESLKH